MGEIICVVVHSIAIIKIGFTSFCWI